MNRSMFPMLVAAGILAALAIAIALWRRQKQSRHLAETKQANLTRQQFVIARGEEISKALANTTLRADELKRITDTIVSEIASRNDGGCLDPYLADTREFLAEEVAKRAAT